MTYDRTSVIRKEDGKFCVRSPSNKDWSGGCYESKGEAEKRLEQVEYFKSKEAMNRYSYNRTAKKSENSRTDGAKKSEVEVAIKAIEKALDAVHDCAPNGKDYREEDGYDSKAYSKEVEAHSARINALNDILSELNELLPTAK